MIAISKNLKSRKEGDIMKLYKLYVEDYRMDCTTTYYDERIWTDKSKADLECMKNNTNPLIYYKVIEFESAD